MNLYAATLKGIRASEEARRHRLLQEMAAAVLRKQCRSGPTRETPMSCPAPDAPGMAESHRLGKGPHELAN